MNYPSSTTSSQRTGSDRLTAGFLAAGILFVAGYTLTRTYLLQPTVQNDNAVVNTVVPHESTLWNATFEDL